jgi:hypothetical protein
MELKKSFIKIWSHFVVLIKCLTNWPQGPLLHAVNLMALGNLKTSF